MNKFLWKVTNTSLEYVPVTVIKNALSKSKANEIAEQVKVYSNTDHAKEYQKFAADNNPGCWRGFPHEAPDEVPGLTRKNKDLIFDLIKESGTLYKDSWPKSDHVFQTTYAKEAFQGQDFTIMAWFNINDQHASNMIHNHHGCLFSGVLYLQAKDTGPLHLYPENYIRGDTHPMWPYKGIMKHYPDDGDLILFPSNLAHDVPANPIEKQRINMAFNVTVLPKQPQQ